MFTWHIKLTYNGKYGNITKYYSTKADHSIIALDNALNQFWIDTGLNFDSDIEYVEWSYCRV